MPLDRFCVSDGKSTRMAAKHDQTERREGHFEGHGGLELFYQTWAAAGSSRGTLVITHGISEHSEAYNHTAMSLASSGWSVCAWDLRGHGRSDGKRGYVRDFHDYALDLGFLLRFLKANGKIEGALALIGHSMGGLVTLRHLIDEEAQSPLPTALVLSSPLLGVALEVPAVKDLAARVLNRFAPSVTLFNEIHYEDLTRDTEMLKSYEIDPLRHDKISSGVYLGMMENMELVKQNASRLRLPTLIQAAGKEKIVSLPAIQEFFPKLGSIDKKLIVYEESYHEIYNDLDREKVLKDLNAFLDKTMGQK